MRILLWHGWLLEGSGSNVYSARLAEVLRADGHDVLLVCQERHAERYPWIDASATVERDVVSAPQPNPAASPSTRGRCVLLRPSIGPVLPVFVLDEYEGFEVRRFVDLDDGVLGAYLDANVEAVGSAVLWHGTELAIVGHAIPGGAIARRGLGRVPYVLKIHGSDLEYAIRPQARFASLAGEGLNGARAVVGASEDVLERARELVPGVTVPMRVVPPGVDVDAFRPMPRRDALLDLAARLERDPDAEGGRPASLDADVDVALRDRDAERLDRLATTYDQAVPDREAAAGIAALAGRARPIVGSFGKLIPQKGMHLALAALARPGIDVDPLVVGFGSAREWLTALDLALRSREVGALAWLASRDELPGLGTVSSAGSAGATFTGRLDHRYAPNALAAMDVLVVPSILEEAFGMVAAEAAAAGALPLVARHSGLAEIATALEDEVGEPGSFSFAAGEGAVDRLAAGVARLLALEPQRGAEVRAAVVRFVGATWSWRATAGRLLSAGA